MSDHELYYIQIPMYVVKEEGPERELQLAQVKMLNKQVGDLLNASPTLNSITFPPDGQHPSYGPFLIPPKAFAGLDEAVLGGDDED